jgi:hypothetical protein
LQDGQRVSTDDGHVGLHVELQSYIGVAIIARIDHDDDTKLSRRALAVHLRS